MIISDISHLEVATEENSVVGGIAVANANAFASANGPQFAGTSTFTSTGAFFNPASFGFFFRPASFSANSDSNSSSSAA